MVRGQRKQQQDHVFSQSEIASIKEERQDLENTLKEAETAGIGTQAEAINKGLIKSQIKRFDEQLAEHSPARVSGSQKDKMVKREKELEEAFQHGLPSKYEMDHPSKCPGAVRKHMKWVDRFDRTGLVREYRNIQRTLHPGEEKSIEQLRKDGSRSEYI